MKKDVRPREVESLAPDEVNSLAINENSPQHQELLGLLPQVMMGLEQDAG